MSEEEILAYNIEIITKQGINKGNLDICMIYGISGNCGKRCPKFKDRTCEEYLTTLENEYKSDELEIERLNKECDTYMKIATKKENIIKEVREYMEKQLELLPHYMYEAEMYKVLEILDKENK